MIKTLYRHAVIFILKPYIRRELPGWGILYRFFVGSHERDWLWQGERERWIKGKLHSYLMSVRIGGWSNRATFFLERFYDLPTQLLLIQQLREGDTFVDVGANEGMMTLLASRLVGDTGTILAFEPNPGPRQILERHIKHNSIKNVELHAIGLSDQDGELDLFVPAKNSGESTFTKNSENEEGQYVKCPVRRGEEIVGEQRVRLIKIDVEGFEARVLKGLISIIQRDKPIIVLELIGRHLARDNAKPKEIFDWLAMQGYKGMKIELRGRSQLRFLPRRSSWDDGDYVFTHHST